ncbi:monosaccharide ABC transporter substrate-binding protein (CUT2 family) [Breznakia blatticola]|uniref:D-galactose/methyl-galactoside binding periplasmic protein MglB n=1 Tax=Breznakia blatticola TaxID=1754012 RepID=A0A4R8A619_9FIRM|nr:galactose ABC transporter substrate-binding protein [Breznakia blatticola]TDW26093.1 monosaccharide ABC transporter substrate-binding protein (CUT2 family) [Breznakia blatticola]
MIKKMAKVLFVALMAVSLVACGGSDDKGGSSGSANVHVFYYDYGDTYISTVRTALDKELDGMDVDYTDYDAAGKQQTQTEQVQTALSSGATMLVVNIVETGSDDAAMTIINAAKEKDVPVVFFNREVSNEVVNSYEKCAFVGTDAKEAGIMQGEMIGDELVANFDKYDLNKDGKISYAMFKGQEGNNEAIYRTQYAVEDADKKLEAAGKAKLEYYDSANSDKYQVDQDGTWSAKAAQDYLATALGKYNDGNNNMIELVICNNDGMAEGAISALQTAGYNKKGGDKTIPVYGVDATKAAVDLIGQGIMAGTIKQDAEGMAKVIALAVKNNAAGEDTFKGIDDSGVEGVKVDDGVAKARIPYQIYTGE